MDGDGADDLIWVGRPDLGGDVYVSLARNGSFAPHVAQDVGTPCVAGCSVRTGDFDGDGHVDLLWNDLTSGNQMRVALGNASGGFDTTPARQTHTEELDWLSYELAVGDFDGDGRDDVAWIAAGPTTRVYVATATSTPGRR